MPPKKSQKTAGASPGSSSAEYSDAADQTIKIRKHRSPAWAISDSGMLLEAYESRHRIIIGSFNSIGLDGKAIKAKAWRDVLTDFLAQNPIVVRMSTEIQVRIKNMMAEVRTHARNIKYHKTGGGPPPPPVPSYIDRLYNIAHGDDGDSLLGIQSGMDSGAPIWHQKSELQWKIKK